MREERRRPAIRKRHRKAWETMRRKVMGLNREDAAAQIRHMPRLGLFRAGDLVCAKGRTRHACQTAGYNDPFGKTGEIPGRKATGAKLHMARNDLKTHQCAVGRMPASYWRLLICTQTRGNAAAQSYRG